MRRRGWRGRLLGAFVVVIGFTVLGVTHGAAGAAVGDWTQYHHDPGGSGVDPSGVSFASASPAWTSPALDGQLFGEPLEATGRIFVATENDTVYALAANSGSILWMNHVGTAVPAGDLPCGDIAPTVGITGTPVIDGGHHEIYVVATELSGAQVAHHLVGLDLYSGQKLLDEGVDPPGSAPEALLQRTGLTIDQGNVVFGFGGNDGDCGAYHGWLVSAPEDGGPVLDYPFDSGPGQREGAVWMGGAAPVVDASGDLWVAVGNGSATSAPYDGSDSVAEFDPGLHLLQSFAPSDWASQNGMDEDLGSTAPALLANGTALQIGKSQTAYLLSRSTLGGIGGQLDLGSACAGADADGGDAVVANVVYVPCRNGIEALSSSPSPPSISVLWQASGSTGGPPIVAGGEIWSIGGSTLYALDPATGATRAHFALGSEANHFPTPSVGDGLLLAPEADRVLALVGSSGLPPGPSPPPGAPPPPGSPAPGAASYWLVGSDGGLFSFGGAGFYGSMGGQPLNQPVVALAATPDGLGYWMLARDGGIFAFGDAPFFGSMGGQPLEAPMVAMAATPDGLGYWTVAADGGVFAFGDAPFFGSMGGRPLNAPIVGMAAAPGGQGYWLVSRDGGIFAFGGGAAFAGSMGGQALNQPIVGMSASPGGGYWEVGADGGVFAFGAPFYGSTGDLALDQPVVAMAPVPRGSGYWFVAADGGVFAYGAAPFAGSMGGRPLAAPIVGMAGVGS